MRPLNECNENYKKLVFIFNLIRLAVSFRISVMEGGHKLQRDIGKYPCLSPECNEVELDIFPYMAN